MVKRKTSLSLSDEAIQMRDELAKALGVSGAAVVEMALREFVRAKRAERANLSRRPQDSLPPPDTGADDAPGTDDDDGAAFALV